MPRRRGARAPRVAHAAAALTGLLACAAASADPIVAARTSRTIRLDGRLEEGAWQEAPPFSDFVESFPRRGVPASFRTEVRVLYDDETLFVGLTCLDPQPAAIVRQLARRDTDVNADRIEVAIDSDSDGRTAYHFIVNAAGVQRDQLLFADVNATDSWDAVWDAAVSIDDRGWSAELAIPLHQLRFPDQPEQRWGMVVRRNVTRTHQVFDSTLIPRDANPVIEGGLVVSRFGRLEGLVELEPERRFELLPYVATRATARPQFSDPGRPQPRLVDPAIDFGLDLKMGLANGLTLTGAVHPDFGQVETDEVIQNLQNSEPFFPEKRPFFLEGLDIFQPVGSEYGIQAGLFYSRRIGLDAPILAAAKVTGSSSPAVEIGVLDAVVMGAGNASLVPYGYAPDPGTMEVLEASPDRRWRFRARDPFHLGPEDALPAAHPVTTNYFAAVARRKLTARGTTAGATFTAATPLEPRCRPSEFENVPDPPPGATLPTYSESLCASDGGNAFALDLNVPGTWGGFAEIAASQKVGGPDEGRLLPDGTVLRAGDLGFGGYFRGGKLGGEPWRIDVSGVYLDPTLDLNPSGFQPLSNYQWVDLVVKYVRPNGSGSLRSYHVDYLLDVNWSTDGRWLARGINSNVYGEIQLPGYQTIGARVGVEIQQYDTREIAFSGVAFERNGMGFAALVFGSDPGKRLHVFGDVFVQRSFQQGPFDPEVGWGWDLELSWRPHPRLETRLDGAYGQKPQGPRWVGTAGDRATFAVQDPQFISLTLRQQLVFTPRLTAQLYAQYFSSAIRWGSEVYAASLQDRTRLTASDLALDPAAIPVPDSHESVLNVNAVLRWEYRLGSTLYLVYTRSQSELPGGDVPATVAPSGLLRGPVTESVLVKWSYWWAR